MPVCVFFFLFFFASPLLLFFGGGGNWHGICSSGRLRFLVFFLNVVVENT